AAEVPAAVAAVADGAVGGAVVRAAVAAQAGRADVAAVGPVRAVAVAVAAVAPAAAAVEPAIRRAAAAGERRHENDTVHVLLSSQASRPDTADVPSRPPRRGAESSPANGQLGYDGKNRQDESQ